MRIKGCCFFFLSTPDSRSKTNDPSVDANLTVEFIMYIICRAAHM